MASSRLKMQKNFTVAGGLKNGSRVFQFGAQFRRVCQITVVRERKLHAAPHAHGQRLGIPRFGLSGGGIAHMPHGDIPRQVDKRFLGKHIGHQPHAHMAVDLSIRPCGYARAFLPAMLESVKTEIGQTGRFLMSADAENAAHSTSWNVLG